MFSTQLLSLTRFRTLPPLTNTPLPPLMPAASWTRSIQAISAFPRSNLPGLSGGKRVFGGGSGWFGVEGAVGGSEGSETE